jgi:sulfur dioxygenase
MGEQTKADVVSMRVAEGDRLTIEGVVLYTPGHTDDSYSFLTGDRAFTGDTLLIRGTGRTDFQNGDARMQYDSIFGKLLELPDDTLVFPAHDYTRSLGLASACHLQGGIDAWKKAGGPLAR